MNKYLVLIFVGLLINCFVSCKSFSGYDGYLYESFDVVDSDAIMREKCFIKNDGLFDYSKGVYIFFNDKVELIDYGYTDKIDFDDDTCRNLILQKIKNSSNKKLKNKSFEYKVVKMKIKYKYVGNFDFPIPNFNLDKTKNEPHKNYINKNIPVYIITFLKR